MGSQGSSTVCLWGPKASPTGPISQKRQCTMAQIIEKKVSVESIRTLSESHPAMYGAYCSNAFKVAVWPPNCQISM